MQNDDTKLNYLNGFLHCESMIIGPFYTRRCSSGACFYKPQRSDGLNPLDLGGVNTVYYLQDCLALEAVEFVKYATKKETRGTQLNMKW